MKRRVLLFTLFVLLCTFICFVFIVELNFVENLKEEQVVLPRNDKHVTSVNEEGSKPSLSESDWNMTPFSKGISISMGNMYSILKKRKQFELRVEKSNQEMWFYVSERLREVEINLHTSAYLNVTIRNIRAHYQAMQSRYHHLNSISSNPLPYQLNWKYWQKNISLELGSLIRKRIDYLQNPTDCKSAKKLVCRVAKSCGFGCQIHHVAFCFIMAYATERTLILDSSNWRYSPRGWDAVFLPVSSTCTEIPRGRSWNK